MSNVNHISVFVYKGGNGEVNFHSGNTHPVMAWPLAKSRYPTTIDMVAKAIEVATRKLGEGNFCPDIEVSTPESRAARVAEMMAR